MKDHKGLPKGIQASVRWDPIDVPIVAPDPATEVGGAAPAASAAPSAAPAPAAKPAPVASPAASPVASPAPAVAAADPSAAASAAPTTAATDAPKAATTTKKPAKGAAAPAAAGQPSASPSAAPSVAPAVGSGADTPKGRRVAPPPARIEPRLAPPAEQLDLVVPEQTGDVVSPAAVKVGRTTFQVPVTLPSAPGRYRLTITVHDGDGVAYDAATQALLPSLIVRVTGDFDGAIQATPTAQLEAGTGFKLGVRVGQPGDRSVGPQGHPAGVEPVGVRQGGSGQRRRDLDPAVGRGVGPDRSHGAAAQRGPADRPRPGQGRRRHPRPQDTRRPRRLPADARRRHPGARIARRVGRGSHARSGDRPADRALAGRAGAAVEGRLEPVDQGHLGGLDPAARLVGLRTRRPDRSPGTIRVCPIAGARRSRTCSTVPRPGRGRPGSPRRGRPCHPSGRWSPARWPASRGRSRCPSPPRTRAGPRRASAHGTRPARPSGWSSRRGRAWRRTVRPGAPAAPRGVRRRSTPRTTGRAGSPRSFARPSSVDGSPDRPG